MPDCPFVENEHGLWCPNCQERIDDSFPVMCTACGYPAEDCDLVDDDAEELVH